MPKQIKPKSLDTCDSVCNMAYLIKVLTVILFVVTILMSLYKGEPLRFFWSWYSFLQLLVHLPLMNAPLPADFERFLNIIWQWASLAGFYESISISFLEYTTTSPISYKFKQTGYETRNFMTNIGTLPSVLFWGPIFISLLIILSNCFKKCT